MIIKASWQNGIEINTDGTTNWSAVILALGIVADFAFYIYKLS